MSNVSNLIVIFLSVLDQIKIYHWQTLSYAKHVASDNLHKNLSKNIDKFVEVLLSKINSRFTLRPNEQISLVNLDDNNIIEILTRFKEYLNRMNFSITPTLTLKESSDLMTIRDEMLVNIEQTLYLFTLN
jgi:hypothetical protein